MKQLFTKLSITLSLVLFGMIASAHTHAMFVVYETDGSITFYAETYQNSAHSSWDGTTPSGGIILGGTLYNFTSVVGTLPTDAVMTTPTRCASSQNIIRYQVVNVGLCSGTYIIRTNSQPNLVPNPRCSNYGRVTFNATVDVTATADESTVYYGYAPMACTNVNATSATATSYVWSTGSTDASTEVCPTATTTYTVTGTNSFGCTGTASVTVNVVDVRCGKKDDKVTMCKTPGKSGNSYEICVAASAVPGQLNSGASLGPCPLAKYKFEQPQDEIAIKTFPNPFTDNLNVQFRATTDENVKLEAFDVTGKSLGILFNEKVEAGVYYEGNTADIIFPKGLVLIKYTSESTNKVFKVQHL